MKIILGTQDQHNGYAAITTTLLMLIVSLTVVGAFTFFALQEVKINRAYTKSIHARYAAESGIEDAAYRIITSKEIGASQTLDVGDAITTVTVTTSGGNHTIRSEGVRNGFQNNMETMVNVVTQGVNFYYGVQMGDGGLIMDNNATVTGNVFSNGSIVGSNGAIITGDATVAGGINADPEVQLTSDNADQAFANTSSRDIAQSFIATAGGVVPKVSVLLAKVGSPSGGIILHITTDNGGKPNTSDIANAIIANSSIASTAGWIDVAFSSQPTLTSGTKYWIVLDYGSNNPANYWNWRKNNDVNAYPDNTGRYTTNWSSGSALWADVGGDLAFKVWIGGTNTKIERVQIGDASSGSGHANLFVNDMIHGSPCPNQYCVIENPARIELPIPPGVIQDWKDASCPTHDAACQIIGDYNVTADTSLGPKEITGNLNLISNKKTLTVTGTIYVQGNITVDGQSTIICDPNSYGADQSCVIISDGWIDVKNNGTFQGSGGANSFIMLLSAAACSDTNILPPCDDAPDNAAIDLHNNATGAIFYASNGTLNILNGVSISEATAYKVHISQNANVTYTQGLANTQFSSGPSGGYEVKQWQEVQ